MRKTFLNLIILIALTLSFNTAFRGEPAKRVYSNTPEGNYEAFYQGIKNKYVFFNWDDTNFDSLYYAYKPLVTSETTDEELHDIFVNLLAPLKDGHRALFSSVCTWKPVNPYISTLNKKVVDKKYLRNKLVVEQEGKWLYSNIGKDITYIRSADFTTFPEKMDSVIAASKDKAGVIIDLRNNRGGRYEVFEKFSSYFTDVNAEIGFFRGKNGRGKYALGNFEPNSINPGLTDNKYTGKVMILTDRYTFSAGEITTLVLGKLEHVTVVGDTTSGAQGWMDAHAVDNPIGGFKLPNDWTVRIANWAFYDADKQVYEGRGYAPDVKVNVTSADVVSKKDKTLETAIELIKS
jgi:hypothetical protein